MEEKNLKGLIAQGLNAMHAGGEVAARAAGSIHDDASHPDLKQALERGQETSKGWQQRLEAAIEEADAKGQGPSDNPVLEAHFEEAKRIRGQAPSDDARDLGIIAAGQQALHYWIATFGTMKAYAGELGMDDVAEDMAACAKEAGEADKQHTELAAKIMSGGQGAKAAA
jgi:ferritin-like metal-binding protein YciE